MDYKKSKLIIFFLALTVAGLGWFFVFSQKKMIEIDQAGRIREKIVMREDESKDGGKAMAKINIAESESQKPLKNPPKIIKAAYSTGWSASSEKKLDYFFNINKTTGLNALVVDIKDYSGLISYDANLPMVDEYKTEEIKINDLNAFVRKFHDAGIYLVARITVFQDPALAKARPDLAVKEKVDGILPEAYPVWHDKKGLAWSDPTSKEVWDYNIAIAKDLAEKGFDEINFDYIRFPTDGDTGKMYFSFWDQKTEKSEILKNFFKYLRESLPNVKISADIFGLVTIQKEDIGVGQILEDIYENFDYVCPMVYPSHYYSGTLGYKNPADHPYEIVKYSIDNAILRLNNLKNSRASTSTPIVANKFVNSKIRPWLQDFNLGAIYTPELVKAQIQAVFDALGDDYSGFMLWNPSNVYTKEAFQ